MYAPFDLRFVGIFVLASSHPGEGRLSRIFRIQLGELAQYFF
jgi:hypothetical protein